MRIGRTADVVEAEPAARFGLRNLVLRRPTFGTGLRTAGALTSSPELADQGTFEREVGPRTWTGAPLLTNLLA
jgi:hypothetical protein